VRDSLIAQLKEDEGFRSYAYLAFAKNLVEHVCLCRILLHTFSAQTIMGARRFPCVFFGVKMASFATRISRPHAPVSAFCGHVCHIVRVGAKKKMLRADTGSDITRMQHMHPIRDRSMRLFPRYPMSGGGLPIYVDSTISCPELSSLPKPTSVGFVNSFPETFGYRSSGASKHVPPPFVESVCVKRQPGTEPGVRVAIPSRNSIIA
jgi:hypothetical protein